MQKYMIRERSDGIEIVLTLVLLIATLNILCHPIPKSHLGIRDIYV